MDCYTASESTLLYYTNGMPIHPLLHNGLCIALRLGAVMKMIAPESLSRIPGTVFIQYKYPLLCDYTLNGEAVCEVGV